MPKWFDFIYGNLTQKVYVNYKYTLKLSLKCKNICQNTLFYSFPHAGGLKNILKIIGIKTKHSSNFVSVDTN